MTPPLFAAGIEVSREDVGYFAATTLYDDGFAKPDSVEMRAANRYAEKTPALAVQALEKLLAILPFEWRGGKTIFVGAGVGRDAELVFHAENGGYELKAG